MILYRSTVGIFSPMASSCKSVNILSGMYLSKVKDVDIYFGILVRGCTIIMSLCDLGPTFDLDSATMFLLVISETYFFL